MTNAQLYFAIGVPMVAVIASLVINIVNVAGLRGEMSSIREDIREIRSDTKIITSKIADMDNRLSIIEKIR